METVIPLVDRLVAHALGITFEDLDPQTVIRVKTRLLDTLGAMAAGHGSQDAPAVLRVAAAWGSGDDAGVPGTSLRLPAAAAAFANSVLARSFDFEPVEADGPEGTRVAAHISGTTVPVALALAELTGASGEELLTALAIGDDITARLAVASGFDVYSGTDNTGTVNALGATLLAARMLGLDAPTAKHALGIAANQLGGTVANIFDAASAFKLPIALAAHTAITSAQLAAAGFTGANDPLEGKHGYFQMYCTDAKPALAGVGLGREFYGDTTIKPWSSCRAAHPSLEACIRLVTEEGVEVEQLQDVSIHITERTLNGFVGARFDPAERRVVAGLFSIHFTAAAGLLHGTVRPEHLTPEAMGDERIAALLERITLIGSLPNSQRLTAEATATLKDGSTRHVRVQYPAGDFASTPLKNSVIEEKFRLNVAFGLPELVERAPRLIELVSGLELAESLEGLFGSLNPTAMITTPIA
ncbi:MmgE/PrpD family protein [Paeniglutamicibacter sp. Y32M11]|uniref:MmgE/PrpD family protein n=1 Tax=Paeniglutamicibacter sp. Y32M11 TaxID=2853258 RepID=UPI0010506382|nr:MmgE/PrpD family protein [Paeniglutamicibacter sp. Y32M11]QXQ09894.1 MmgE/PrpD family protein [Paeniglutamicibacter sp. Y32M11]